MPKTICLDFDGVCNTYDGWKGEDNLFSPRDGLHAFLRKLHEEGFRVVIHSTRPAGKIRDWLKAYDLQEWVEEVTDHKPPAVVYLDDRAVTFEGDYGDALLRVKDFRAFWETPK